MDVSLARISKYGPVYTYPIIPSLQVDFITLMPFVGTGVIYGDIGTSPLYVYSSTFTSLPSYDDLVGVCFYSFSKTI